MYGTKQHDVDGSAYRSSGHGLHRLSSSDDRRRRQLALQNLHAVGITSVNGTRQGSLPVLESYVAATESRPIMRSGKSAKKKVLMINTSDDEIMMCFKTIRIYLIFEKAAQLMT